MAAKDVGYLIKSIDEKIKARADTDLKKHNLTMVQSRVLIFLHSRGGQATQKEIENHLDISHPAVVGIVSRMEQNGHLITWMDPQNKRNKVVQLTSCAQDMGDMMKAMRGQLEAVLLKGFSPEDAAHLKEMLLLVYNNLAR